MTDNNATNTNNIIDDDEADYITLRNESRAAAADTITDDDDDLEILQAAPLLSPLMSQTIQPPLFLPSPKPLNIIPLPLLQLVLLR
mmetsp:Transcript_17760/g.22083  ORF Transcript_17760/g.22083 Transcript_17760/m.22083 type:complete len:86 (+) Transcript_17760:183-440(+)